MQKMQFTHLGENLIAKWKIGAARIIDSVWFGDGQLTGQDPKQFTDLISPLHMGTTNTPTTTNNVINLVIQYRNNFTAALGGSLKESFWIYEFGVFAIDPDIGRILLLYGTLGNTPDPVYAFSVTGAIAKEYRTPITVSGEAAIMINCPSEFVTRDDLEERISRHEQETVCNNENGVHGMRYWNGHFEVFCNGQWNRITGGAPLPTEEFHKYRRVSDGAVIDAYILRDETTNEILPLEYQGIPRVGA